VKITATYVFISNLEKRLPTCFGKYDSFTVHQYGNGKTESSVNRYCTARRFAVDELSKNTLHSTRAVKPNKAMPTTTVGSANCEQPVIEGLGERVKVIHPFTERPATIPKRSLMMAEAP
jgi:hypothetical protein